MAANITTFPPDTLCFVWSLNQTAGAPQCTNFTATVTQAMVDYLNLTSSIGAYKQAYCLDPQGVSLLLFPALRSADACDDTQEDSCPFGYCPKPDIAGECA